ncbi:uncharacterized protein LOC105681640 [Bombus impatiens]|uniref:Uncharacterized protein LOC105681640 n=1 Tax=Bombus impatiens TaxID=132113 RepID=A0A6P3V5G6_BOMIM|nr:uncharacterized protein LOC105681640 [Bombus impatiens]
MSYKCLKSNGASIEETLGSWGFSNRVSNSGQELRRLRCLFNKMDGMKTRKPMMCVKYNCLYDPDAWHVKPSPDECKPIWTMPMRRPLITYSSTADIIMTSNLDSIGTDLLYPIPGRSYLLQGTDKWYRHSQCCNQQPNCSVRHPCAPQC